MFPIMRNPVAFETLITHLTHHIVSRTISPTRDGIKKVDVVIGLEARGFLLGPIIAMRLGTSAVNESYEDAPRLKVDASLHRRCICADPKEREASWTVYHCDVPEGIRLGWSSPRRQSEPPQPAAERSPRGHSFFNYRTRSTFKQTPSSPGTT